MAVAVGFEPTVRLPPHALSRRAPLAARTRHRRELYKCPVRRLRSPLKSGGNGWIIEVNMLKEGNRETSFR